MLVSIIAGFQGTTTYRSRLVASFTITTT
ncbi:hypothetical protein MAR_015207 [Mya arenaria]|uniref:Uncharacterized protein n=1 Tax=Mya arenaria TaxID=6604 RepID=A0ABY7FKN0_MYAAR|nr:hypothetical protein MAR_015207 [Mya arenaria]